MPPSRRVLTGLIIALLGTLSAQPPAHAGQDPDTLYYRALRRLARGTAEDRQFALQDLEEAARVAGKRIDILHAVAWTYSAMGRYGQAHNCLDRITKLAPDDGEAQFRLGQLWKWEWLASIDPADYRNALEHFYRAAKLSTSDLESRLAITALALVRNNTKLGMAAARSAALCDPEAVEGSLAIGCAAYRAGNLSEADSAFRAAWPRVPAHLRRRFTDLHGVAYDAGHKPISAEEADSASATFWSDVDPDLTTPENEAQLDFLSRVALAVLLFRDEQGVRWDMRAELFARYGIPKSVLPPPPPAPDADLWSYLSFAPMRFGNGGSDRGPEISVAIPFHMQTWVYPDLGMSVDLWDRSLNQNYGLSVQYGMNADATPRPELLAIHPDLVALEGGRGVYRALPPGVVPMPGRAVMSLFPADSGARLVAHLLTEGGPSDTLWGSWAVVDRAGHAVARSSGQLAISACDPTGHRIAQFDAVVPPGDYRADLVVDDRHGRRGVVHLEGRAWAAPAGLAMSDLVLVCGTSLGAAGGPVLIEPDFDRQAGDRRTISVYFELDHLALDSGGQSRFAYRYAVRRVEPEASLGRKPVTIVDASREEENVGARRRQFVSARVPPLDPGTYDFEVEVRDLSSGAKTTRTIRFVKS